MRNILSTFVLPALFLTACQSPIEADYLIKNGTVYIGDNTQGQNIDIAIKGESIVFIGNESKHIDAVTTLDASGLIIAPGFIDPHTHSLIDLKSNDSSSRENANYRLQGVTTVFNGNDGYGNANIAEMSANLTQNGIGTNTAFFVGHLFVNGQLAVEQAQSKKVLSGTVLKRCD